MTEEACRKCGACCKTDNEYGVILFPREVEGIAGFLGIPARELLTTLCTARTVGGVLVYYLKKRRAEDACRFLTGSLCGIYPVRPIQCRLAPYEFFSDYGNWAHVPCIGGREAFARRRKDSSASDRELLLELVECGYRRFLG